jgi:hypothetical protein
MKGQTSAPAQFKPLMVCHTFMSLLLASAWFFYWLTHSRFQVKMRPHARLSLGQHLSTAFAHLAPAFSDLLLGAVVIALFIAGTRIYLSRIQTWVDARGAGQAVAFGARDLKESAVAANAKPGEEKRQ